MIRFIAVMDSKKGLANEHGIPWQGQVPTDTTFFRNKTIFNPTMMGAGWYKEQSKPLPNRRNLVATTSLEELRPGFERVSDARAFLLDAKSRHEDIWVGGGAALFTSVLDLADELLLTMVEGDFHCTKFFPAHEDIFEMVDKTDTKIENNIPFTFTLWKSKK